MAIYRLFPSADDVAWVDGLNGYPSPGPKRGAGIQINVPSDWLARVNAGQQVPGVTKTQGLELDPVFGQANSLKIADKFLPWQSAKKGIANTVGALPISHQASHDALMRLSGTMSWFYNYGVRPWCYVSFLKPLTGPVQFGPGQGNWNDPGPDVDVLPIPAGLQFVPMFLDGAHVNTQELAWAQPWAQACGYCITFNEPYGEGAMTPAQAVAAWPQIQAMCDAVGAKVIAPSIGFSVASSSQNTWLSDFLALIASNGLRVDILNFHDTLGNYSGAFGVPGQVQAFFNSLDAMHATYPSYDIWVTETQMFVSNDQAGVDMLRLGLQNFLAGLEARPWVKRYAWWPLGTDPSKPGGADFDSLSMCDTGGFLTQTGQNYNGLTRK